MNTYIKRYVSKMSFTKVPYLLSPNVINNENIILINTIHECDKFVQHVRSHIAKYGFRAIGLDCEWVAATSWRKRSRVSLVQIAVLDPTTYKGTCGLIRIFKLHSIPNSLKTLLGDSTVIKVGVAISNDAKFLANDYSLTVKSTLDLRFLAILCGYEPRGLAKLASEVSGIVMSKSKNIQLSNWNINILTERQVQYAADDARSAILIFKQLLSKINGITCEEVIQQEQWSSFINICVPHLEREFTDKEYMAKLAHRTILIFNVPESKSPHVNIQQEHDRKEVERIIKSISNVPTDSLKLSRVGPKYNLYTIRRLKVVLNSIEDACTVLKYKYKVCKPYNLMEYITGRKIKTKKNRRLK